MEKVSTISVGGTQYSIGSDNEGTLIAAELYSDVEKNTYIRCISGEIKDTDTILFARYITNVNAYYKDKHKTKPHRYRGWVIPNYAHGMQIKKGLSATKDGYDYWKITLSTGLSFLDYEKSIDDVEYKNRCARPLTLKRKCGVAVVRDNKRITEYMPFTVVYNNLSDVYSVSRIR